MLEDTKATEVTTTPTKAPRKPRPSEIAAKKVKAAKKTSAKKPAKKAKVKAAANGTGKKLGRPLLYTDQTLVRMPKGTLKRVHAACKDDEGQGDFMRTAIDAELKRRRK